MAKKPETCILFRAIDSCCIFSIAVMTIRFLYLSNNSAVFLSWLLMTEFTIFYNDSFVVFFCCLGNHDNTWRYPNYPDKSFDVNFFDSDFDVTTSYSNDNLIA